MLANNENFYIINNTLIFYGMWCSLVAHLTGGQEVASSSLVIPIFKKWLKTLIYKALSHFSLF
nr:MAG TPA: hypothetical protein [Caudoviricetes sp.]